MTLDRDQITSLYAQIAAQLRREIAADQFQPSGRLPSEAELMQRFAVSRVTIRLALGKLGEEGLVERRQGKGTYVSTRRLQHGLNVLQGFHDGLAQQGLALDMQLITLERRNLPEGIPTVSGKTSRTALYLERLHRVDGEPVAVACSHLPDSRPEIRREQLEAGSSYAVLQSLGWQIERADLIIRATAATPRLAKALQIRTGTPLLMMARTSFLSDGEACEHTVFHVRHDRCEFALNSINAAHTSENLAGNVEGLLMQARVGAP